VSQREDDAAHLRRHLRRVAAETTLPAADVPHAPLDLATLQWLRAWPTPEEAHELVPKFRAVPQDAHWPLAFAAYCLVDELETGRPVLNPPRRIDNELVARGLARVTQDKNGDHTVVLTDPGRSLARFAVAAPPRPPHLRAVHVPYRATLRSLISVMCPPPRHKPVRSFLAALRDPAP
jgi:hypothetical protein